ncbi:MAG: lysophospholipase [Clostridia bacterium]|nr:lysophospholipase [Clostridia bacterium]
MQRFTTTSSDGKTTLAAYKLVPANPRGMVQISHGMCEYILRYEGFAKFLAEAGIIVFGHDHLGHGYSVKSSKGLGFTAEGGGAEYLVEDVHNLALKMKQEYPDLPIVLFGHSMGSFIARAVLEKYSSTYKAAVICGTAGPGMPTAFGKAVTKHLMTFLGEHHRSKLMKKIVFGGYNKNCGENCDPNAWLTRDEEVVKAYNADLLCSYNFTLRGYYDLFDLIETISREEWASTLSKDLPVMVVSGEQDPVGGWGKGVQKVAESLLAAEMRDVTLKLYPEMRHEIINELEHETVWTDLKEWIEQKLA